MRSAFNADMVEKVSRILICVNSIKCLQIQNNLKRLLNFINFKNFVDKVKPI